MQPARRRAAAGPPASCCRPPGSTRSCSTQLESFGLVDARAGSGHYDADALVVARTAGELAAFGIEPRHLRAFRTAADREVGLVEQVVAPLRRSASRRPRRAPRRPRAELAALCVRLHAALVKAALDRGGA